MLPIQMQQLKDHLAVAGRRVKFTQVEGGFLLRVVHSRGAFILHAQRNHPRVFKSLTRAATFLQSRGILRFEVEMLGRDGRAITAHEEDFFEE